MASVARRVKVPRDTFFLPSPGARMRYHKGMSCEACGGKMHSASVVCPHCGARRKNVAPVKLEGAEIRALLATSGQLQDDEERDWLATLVLPHPSTHGGARLAEIALTVVAMPFIACGVLTMALNRLRRSKGRMKMRGELGPLALMSLMGSLGVWSVLGLAGASGTTIWYVILGSIGALSARAALRASSLNAAKQLR